MLGAEALFGVFSKALKDYPWRRSQALLPTFRRRYSL
jgi:hypothetical protein